MVERRTPTVAGAERRMQSAAGLARLTGMPFVTPPVTSEGPGQASPYRSSAFPMAPPKRPTWPRPVALRLKELAGLGALVAACDLAVWSDEGITLGGFGMAFLRLSLPATLVLAAGHVRKSARVMAMAFLLFIVACRCVYEPLPGSVVGGLGLLGTFALALRTRRTFLPEVVVSALSSLRRLPSRVGAALRGMEKATRRTRVGHVAMAPLVIPAALCIGFVSVFALANPVVAHALDTGWKAVASVLGFPSLLRVAVWCVAFAVACALLRPAPYVAKDREAAVEGEASSLVSILVARNTLAALNVLFFFYNALDAAYLLAGAPPTGMRTQQYAHQGAFWLTIARRPLRSEGAARTTTKT